ncbi:MAG: prolyl oligopeptidase family serine peptidase [Nannocystaceae bacterium]|nr:prolyl oligopeptidase family serine peptidase [bacterium]
MLVRPAVARWLCLLCSLSVGCARGADAEPEPSAARGPAEPQPGPAPSETAERAPDAAPIEIPSTYEEPPADVVDIVDAPSTPSVTVSPTGDRVLLAHYDALPSIEDVAAPFERLAGLRIDAERFAERRTRMYESLDLVDIASGKKTAVSLPEGIRMGPPRWSPDGTRIAFTRWQDDGLRLWVVDVATGTAKEAAPDRVNDVLTQGFAWLPGGNGLLLMTVPPDTPAAPRRPRRPVGPSVSDTTGEKATNRTYQDLLQNPYDEALFEHLATVQLLELDLETEGPARPVGAPSMVLSVDPAPGGEYLLVEQIRRPFSYAVPYYRFGLRVEVWDRRAKVVRTVADLPLAEEIPIGGVRQGPRRVQWHPQQPDTLVWTEALDEGDPKKEVLYRDRVMLHAAPFADVPKMLVKVQHRLTRIAWTETPGQFLVTDYDRDRRWTKTVLHDQKEERVLIDRSVRDAYGDPGRPVYELRSDGTYVIPVEDGAIALAGSGATPKGYRPFLQRMSLQDGSTERIFESGDDEFASFVDYAASGDMLVWRESKAEPANLYAQDSAGDRRPLTTFADPHPQLTGIEKRILKYTRKDGVELSGTLYLPPGYEEGERLPLVVWAYPIEFNDKDTAGQVRASDNRFTRLRGTSPLMFLTQGYAVLDGAAMPIVGDPETMNDSFLPQIVDSAAAAIDAVVELGVADPQRVGVAGHSYGAFMTANLLAHSDLFRAGIARSGAYNRTLTPFGFQSERRTLWEAPQAYMNVSPLFAADELDEPILLVHGEDDANSGTYPLQSKRLFHALKGNGGTARLVMLPHESHGYVARESVLHVLAESFRWFDTHVKNAKPGPSGVAPAG